MQTVDQLDVWRGKVGQVTKTERIRTILVSSNILCKKLNSLGFFDFNYHKCLCLHKEYLYLSKIKQIMVHVYPKASKSLPLWMMHDNLAQIMNWCCLIEAEGLFTCFVQLNAMTRCDIFNYLLAILGWKCYYLFIISLEKWKKDKTLLITQMSIFDWV